MNTGQEFGMESSGMAVYCASCTVANLWLVMRFNQHDVYSTVSFALMLISPYFFYWLLCMELSESNGV